MLGRWFAALRFAEIVDRTGLAARDGHDSRFPEWIRQIEPDRAPRPGSSRRLPGP